MITTAADRSRKNGSQLLDLMIVGGIIAAYLTQPPFPQYLVPLLPPVTIRFAIALDQFERPAIRRLITGATVLSCVAGLGDTAHYILRIRKRGLELVQAVRLGNDVALLTKGRSISTLSPERIAGANTNLDARFAAGPFLFRTSDTLAEQALRYGYSPTWQHIDAALELAKTGSSAGWWRASTATSPPSFGLGRAADRLGQISQLQAGFARTRLYIVRAALKKRARRMTHQG